jgi:translin
MPVSDVEQAVNEAFGRLEKVNAARDKALVDSRQVIRHAAQAIRALHRGDFDAADQILSAGRELVSASHENLVEHPELYWTGYVQDAQKELAEAYFVAAMVRGKELPPAAELAVEDAPYLNGLAEAASEMRRYILDIIRHGEPGQLETAESALQVMDDVYTSLITVDLPDAITGGLRRTTDALRAVLERTRGDLTLTLRQAELARALARDS